MTRKAVVKLLSNELEPHGFTFSQDNWLRKYQEQVQVVNHQYSCKTKRFTLNIGIIDNDVWDLYWNEPIPLKIDEAMCTIKVRIGELLPDGCDKWWDLNEFGAEEARQCSDAALSFFGKLNNRHSLLQALQGQSFLVTAMQPYIPILLHLLGDTARAHQILEELKDGCAGPWDERIQRIIETINR